MASHRFITAATDSGDPGGRDAERAVEHTRAIKRWTTQILRLPDTTTVLVSETTCADPGCPLVETTVAVFDDAGTRSWRLVRPRIAVTKLMLQQALATPPRIDAAPPPAT